MIEIIYNETKKGNGENESVFQIPNNIRQIGESREHLKIYMEDYVYTFLKRMSRQDTENGCGAILLGEAKWKDSVSYIFIRSALKIEEPDINAEHMPFSDASWGNIHKDIEQYFTDQEVIGWSLSLPGFNMKINDIILRAHLNHFAGNQKVLFVMEPGEKDESFFLYENNQMTRQNGFYIYYEKNERMQSYMIEKGGNNSIEETEHASDKAVVNFRKIVSGKKEEKVQGLSKRLLYGVSACSVAVLLAFGITFFNNYHNMEDTVSKISGEKTAASDVSADASQKAAGQDETAAKTPEAQSPEAQSPINDKNNSQAETPKDNDTDMNGNQTPSEDSMAQNESDSSEKQKQENNSGSQTQNSQTDPLSPTREGSTDASNETPRPTETLAPDTSTKSTSGQGLNIPYQRYVVKRGDTLTQISESFYGTIGKLDDICRANNLSPEDIIYAGQTIVLP